MAAKISIRLATLGEAGTIARMSKDYIEQGLPWSWTVEKVERAIAAPCTNVAVAFAGRELLGFGIMSYSDAVAHLVLLAVRADIRRRGLASTIVEWLEKVARTAGIGRLRVEARADNAPALALYRKLGYVERRRVAGMYSGVEDGVRFEKTLADGTFLLIGGET